MFTKYRVSRISRIFTTFPRTETNVFPVFEPFHPGATNVGEVFVLKLEFF